MRLASSRLQRAQLLGSCNQAERGDRVSVPLLTCRPTRHPMQVICDASCTDISRSTAADWLLKVGGCRLRFTGLTVKRRLRCTTRRTGPLASRCTAVKM